MAAFDAGTSAAKRRGERRLRSWWRHKRTWIAAVLAPPLVPKGGHQERRPKEPEGSHSTRVGLAEYYELSSDDGKPSGGASGIVGALAAGAGAAARRHRVRAGGTVAECSPFLRHVSAGCCRAGYRRAQDHPREHPLATLMS